jgi:Peptidase_C39 like family
VPSASTEAGWISDSKLWLALPHRTQLDNGPYAQSNCGPASLGMILEAYGLKNYPTDALRGEVNRIQGNSDPSQGTALPALAAVAQRAGLYPVGMYARPGVYARWSMDDVRASLKAGRPVIMLTRYADLPGNSGYQANTNHYIVLSGLVGDQFIYNDPAYAQGRGAGLLISPETLKRASDHAVLPGQAVAFALGPDGGGLLQPNRLGSTATQEEEEFELADEEDLILAAMDDEMLGNLSLALDEVTAFVPGFVDESKLFPVYAVIPTPGPAESRPPASAPASDSGSSGGFPLGRAAAILSLMVLGAYAPGAVAVLLGHIRQ